MNKLEAIQARMEQVRCELFLARNVVNRLELAERSLWDAMGIALSDQPVATQDAPQATCGTCGADVSTEFLYSLHYVIDDERYYNIGHCPTRDDAGEGESE